MNPKSRDRWLVIGIGNTYRQDDGVGPYVARLLRNETTPNLAVIEPSGEATTLIQAWSETDRVIIVDAVRSGAPPGTIHRLDARQTSLATDWFLGSTHSLGVVQAIEISRSLGRLPDRMAVYGVEGESYGWGVGLSQRVERAARELAETIASNLRRRAHWSGT